MKKVTFILFLLLIHNLLISQTLVDTTKRWNTLLSTEFAFNYGSELIRFGNDTTVGGMLYKKVLRATSEVQTEWNSYGLIRETSDKKIYYRTDTSNQEYLLYDFGLNIGDTLTFTALDSYNSGGTVYLISAPLFVESIDSLLVANTFRKQLHMASPYGWETDQWVEGMGSKAGMLHIKFGMVGGDQYNLMCFNQNDSLLWQNPSYSDCYFVESISEKPSREITFSVNPDPVTAVSILSIKGASSYNSMTLEIYSCAGKKIAEMRVEDGMAINNNDFVPGIYLFRLVLGSGKTKTIKVNIL